MAAQFTLSTADAATSAVLAAHQARGYTTVACITIYEKQLRIMSRNDANETMVETVNLAALAVYNAAVKAAVKAGE